MEEKNNKKVMALGITLVIVFVIYTVELVSLGIIRKNEGKRLDENGNVVDKNNRDEVDNDEKNNDNNHSKMIYFYSNNNDLLWLDYNSDKKSEYDTKYELLNKYTCNDDMCSVLVSDGTCGAGNINYTDEDGVFIIDDNKINYYDYKENKVVYSYDALKTSNSENFSTYDEGYIIYHGDASNKSALLGLNGKILSNYYDSIIGTTKSYSNNHRVASYQINDKYGILSLETGKELTDAVYENLQIYEDYIVILKDNLNYIIDVNGNIKSNGYSNILYATDNVIIIEENNLIDIIDYSGNSLIPEKINSNGYKKRFINNMCGGMPAGPLFTIEKNDNNIVISIPDALEGASTITTYVYNELEKTLTK